MTKPAISDEQLKTVENCCRLVLQKIAKVRIADTVIRSVGDNSKSYSSAYIREVEKTARFADKLLSAAIDELRDVLTDMVPREKAEGTAAAAIAAEP